MTADAKTRELATRGEPFGGGFAGALTLHLAAASFLVGWGYYAHSGKEWGNAIAANGSIQASMVSSLPLPPRPTANPDSILATEAPTPAPVVAAPHTVEAARPDAIDIPVKTAKPIPTADKNTPSTAPAPTDREGRPQQGTDRRVRGD